MECSLKSSLETTVKQLFIGLIVLCAYFFQGDSDDDDEEDSLLKKTGNFVAASESLPKGIIQVKDLWLWRQL